MKKLAWKEFSEYIRRKNADFYGFVSCITCDSKAHWKDMQAGHYKHGKLDFDEMNVNPQCARCNKWLSGKLDVYSIKLIEKYGLEKVTELHEKANRTTYEKLSRKDYEDIFNKYKKINEQTGGV